MEPVDFGQLFEDFRDGDSDSITWRVERDWIEEGKSFSADAMDGLRDLMLTFVGARIMAAWRRRNEPPSVVTIRMEVEVG